jgi:hypothetical protein
MISSPRVDPGVALDTMPGSAGQVIRRAVHLEPVVEAALECV